MHGALQSGEIFETLIDLGTVLRKIFACEIALKTAAPDTSNIQ